ncbi:MAG: AAA family ATPase [Candidatus Sumerlaeota bacterium]|nr:AAA family ATPase [Candidatus Sumerlaeota bacterium]
MILSLTQWIDFARNREIKFSRVSIVELLKWLFPRPNDIPAEELSHGDILIKSDGKFPMRELSAHFKELIKLGNGGPESPEQEVAEEESQLPSDTRAINLDLNCTAVDFSSGSSSAERVKVYSHQFVISESTPFYSQTNSTMPALPISFISPFNHRLYQLQFKQLTELEKAGGTAPLIEALNKADPGIRAIKILSPSGNVPVLYVDHGQHGLSPVSVLGDGVRRALAIALSLTSVSGGVLLIDELETFIHYTALRELFAWLVDTCRSLNVQLFATTHSLEAIDAILEAIHNERSDDLVVYRLRPSAEITKSVRMDTANLMSARSTLGLEIR